MIDATIDTRGLDRLGRDLRERADEAGAEAARSGADEFVAFMERHAPVDTGRYKRAWLQAGNTAGLTHRRLPRLKPGKFASEIGPALDRQIDRYISAISAAQGVLDAWYHDRGRRPDAYYRRKQREINSNTRRLQRAVEQKRRFVGADGPVLVFDLFSNGRIKYDPATGKTRRLRLTTVRDKVYGGRGEQVTIDGETVVRLVNLEPHKRLVERRHRIVARALAQVRRHTDAVGRRVRLQK